MRKVGNLERREVQSIFGESLDIEVRKRRCPEWSSSIWFGSRIQKEDKELRGRSRGVGVEGEVKERDNKSKLASDDSALKFHGHSHLMLISLHPEGRDGK